MSSIQSAPATIPATRLPTFTGPFTPVFPLTRRCSPTNRSRPTFPASRTAGTRPARDTRFGSSNRAQVFNGACNNRIYEVPFPTGTLELQQPPSTQLRGHFAFPDPPSHPHPRGGSRRSEEKWQKRLTDADRRALPPLFWTHVNPYGRF